MSLEYTMRQRVVRALKPLHAVSVENPTHAGTPDVNCSTCWIELKALPAAPVKDTTPVRVPHFTQQQKIWLLKRCLSGGRADLLIMIGREWILLDGLTAARYLGELSMLGLRDVATRYWPQTPTDKELLQCFSPPPN